MPNEIFYVSKLLILLYEAIKISFHGVVAIKEKKSCKFYTGVVAIKEMKSCKFYTSFENSLFAHVSVIPTFRN